MYREIILDKKNYKSYQDFYLDIVKIMDAKNDKNCLEKDDLNFNANILAEFLWDFHKENIKYIFIGFDRKKISEQKNYEDYNYNLILKVFENLVKEFSNIKLEFRL